MRERSDVREDYYGSVGASVAIVDEKPPFSELVGSPHWSSIFE